MTEWKTYKLEEIARKEKGAIKSGPFGSNIGRKFFVESGVPVIRGNNLPNNMEKFFDDGFVFVTEEKAKELNCWAVKDDLLFTAAGTIGQVGLLTGIEKYPKYVISNKQIKVSLDTKIVNPLFAFYWLSSPCMNEHIKNQNTGSTIPLINLSVVKSLPISLPSLNTQNEIAEILSSLDDKIELNNQINANLEALAQAIFKQWFIDFEFPDENGNPYKSSGGKMVESELGEIPDGWKPLSLAQIADITIGRTPPRKEHQWFSFNESDYKWVSIKDMGSCGAFILSSSEFLTKEAVQKFKVPIIEAGTVIISFKLTVGRVAITAERMLSNEAIAHIRLKDQQLSPEFVYLFAKQFDYDSLGSTSSIATAVNSQSIKQIPIVIPEPSVMTAFNALIKDLFNGILNTSLETNGLKSLRDALLPRLVSGQISIE